MFSFGIRADDSKYESAIERIQEIMEKLGAYTIDDFVIGVDPSSKEGGARFFDIGKVNEVKMW